VKENEVLPLGGVTVTDDVPGCPTLGVIVPPLLPSERAIAIEPLKVPLAFVTVKLLLAAYSGPPLGPLTE
jgi:hypothetical protein